MAGDFHTWQFDAHVVYCADVPLVVGTKVIVITGGFGWSARSYTVQSYNASFNLGAPDGVQNIVGLPNQTGIPAAAASAGGIGYGLVDGTRIAFDGNSLTAGFGIADAADFYPFQCAAILGPSYAQANYAVSGQTTQGMDADAAVQLDGLGFEVLVAWEIGNDIVETPSTGAEAVDNFIAYCQNRRAAGYRVVVLSVTPRDSSSSPAPFDTERLAANALLTDAFATSTAYDRVYTGATWADALIDVASNPALVDPDDATYYNADHVHLTVAGAAAVAADVANGILVALLPAAPPPPTLTVVPADPSPPGGDVSFEFSSATADSYECALDASGYAPCSSPQAYTGLSAGAHTFAVRAINEIGTSEATSYSWSVDVTPPSSGGTASLGTGVGTARGRRP